MGRKSDAGRIEHEQEKQRFHDELAAERAEITTLYAKYQATVTPRRKLKLAVVLKSLLTERRAELSKRMRRATPSGCRCERRGDPIEDMYTDMLFDEAFLVYARMLQP